MPVRPLLPYAVLAAAGLALAACGDDPAPSDAPAAQVELAEEAPPLAIPPAAPAPAAEADAGVPTEPLPYDQMQAEEERGPAQKADAENENVFY
jgi:hypothetical protein